MVKHDRAPMPDDFRFARPIELNSADRLIPMLDFRLSPRHFFPVLLPAYQFLKWFPHSFYIRLFTIEPKGKFPA